MDFYKERMGFFFCLTDAILNNLQKNLESLHVIKTKSFIGLFPETT